VETVVRETGSGAIPRAVYAAIAVLIAVACMPPLMIARSRVTTSRTPPLSSFPDMDYQPKFKAQTKTNLFADGRAMRAPVPGTVARGQLQEDDHFYRGLQPQGPSGKYRPVSMQNPAPSDPQSVDPKQRPPETQTQQPPEPPWAKTFPLEVTDELIRRGREQFNVYCATCHGRTGAGNGPVSVRALELEQGTWIPPTSIHADYVREQPVGKLFNTITNGVRKMPGYGDQIKPRDRWAIVLYLRALQRSRNATPEDIPADQLPELRDLK
jgi:mono/diheme cytochrome c family protein